MELLYLDIFFLLLSNSQDLRALVALHQEKNLNEEVFSPVCLSCVPEGRTLTAKRLFGHMFSKTLLKKENKLLRLLLRVQKTDHRAVAHKNMLLFGPLVFNIFFDRFRRNCTNCRNKITS